MRQRRIVQSVAEWFGRNARDLPWRRTRDPYAIWVSEIMLQQTQVKTVQPYWRRWMRALPDVAALARAKPERLHKLWEGLGYYARVRNLQKAAQLIVEKHGGKFPEDFEQVLALPGIGRYTAGAICSIALNQPKPILDGNVMRVLTRLFGIAGNPRGAETNRRLWRIAEELVREAARQRSPRANRASAFNQGMMELGALVCTPRHPRCGVCPLAKQCVAYRQGRVEELPGWSRRVQLTPRRFVAFVAQNGRRWLVRQRPAGVVNAHLWEFPNVEVGPDGSDLRRAARSFFGLTPKRQQRLCVIKHSITRYRITLEVFRVGGVAGAGSEPARGRWVSRAELNRLAFAGAHKQILRRLEEGRNAKPEGRSPKWRRR
jgi:A/G-specific adenine glycosylase